MQRIAIINVSCFFIVVSFLPMKTIFKLYFTKNFAYKAIIIDVYLGNNLESYKIIRVPLDGHGRHIRVYH